MKERTAWAMGFIAAREGSPDRSPGRMSNEERCALLMEYTGWSADVARAVVDEVERQER
jgi:hypothetical protein